MQINKQFIFCYTVGGKLQWEYVRPTCSIFSVKLSAEGENRCDTFMISATGFFEIIYLLIFYLAYLFIHSFVVFIVLLKKSLDMHVPKFECASIFLFIFRMAVAVFSIQKIDLLRHLVLNKRCCNKRSACSIQLHIVFFVDGLVTIQFKDTCLICRTKPLISRASDFVHNLLSF